MQMCAYIHTVICVYMCMLVYSLHTIEQASHTIRIRTFVSACVGSGCTYVCI